MKKLKVFVCGLSALIGSASLHAEQQSGPREILDMGCHLNDNTCYVTISGAAVGPAICSGVSIRWNEKSSANGKSTLALLTAAFMAGKTVGFNVVDSCYGAYPTFNYMNVYR